MIFETRRAPEAQQPAVAPADQQQADEDSPATIVRQPVGDPTNPVGYVELSSDLDFGAQSLATAPGRSCWRDWARRCWRCWPACWSARLCRRRSPSWRARLTG
ncbi:MAG: hypothetical protein R2844_01080 [Caldilineales bacterium]